MRMIRFCAQRIFRFSHILFYRFVCSELNPNMKMLCCSPNGYQKVFIFRFFPFSYINIIKTTNISYMIEWNVAKLLPSIMAGNARVWVLRKLIVAKESGGGGGNDGISSNNTSWKYVAETCYYIMYLENTFDNGMLSFCRICSSTLLHFRTKVASESVHGSVFIHNKYIK